MKSFREQLIDFLNYYRNNPSSISTEKYVDTYLDKMKNKKIEGLISEDALLSMVVRKFNIKELRDAFNAGKTENDFVSWFDKFIRETGGEITE